MREDSAQFNDILLKSIDVAISEVLSDNVLTSLYQHLADRYDITRDEIPYRLETVYTSLNEIFGFHASRTLERQIAKRLCAAYNIAFLDTRDCTLQMYVQRAKELR